MLYILSHFAICYLFHYHFYVVNHFNLRSSAIAQIFVTTYIYKHVPFCNFSLYLKKAGLASRNIVHLNFNSTLYRSLLQSLLGTRLLLSIESLVSEPKLENMATFRAKQPIKKSLYSLPFRESYNKLFTAGVKNEKRDSKAYVLEKSPQIA